MKRIMVSIIAALYLLASTGTAVELHYCMGKVVDWSFAHISSASCDQCGMEKQEAGNHCCKDEQKYVKSLDDQKSNTASQEFSPLSTAAPASTFHLPPFTFEIRHLNYEGLANAPPEDKGLFLKHRSLLL
ncbi:MAG: hypothetical protein WBP58_06510 [Chitinophagaceae bacterium]